MVDGVNRLHHGSDWSRNLGSAYIAQDEVRHGQSNFAELTLAGCVPPNLDGGDLAAQRKPPTEPRSLIGQPFRLI